MTTATSAWVQATFMGQGNTWQRGMNPMDLKRGTDSWASYGTQSKSLPAT
jgi:hypothetical protein